MQFTLLDFRKIKSSGKTEVEEYLFRHRIRRGNVPRLNRDYVVLPFYKWRNPIFKTNGKKVEAYIYLSKDLCEKILMFGEMI